MNDSIEPDQPYSPTVRFPRRVVILGNDVSAWMAATMLLRHFGRLGIRVTVCSDGPAFTTGFSTYATTTALVDLLKDIGIDEHDMLRACNGTYRLATQFSDWASEGRDFWQPLGMPAQRVDGYPLFDAWFSERKAGRLLRPLHSYAAQWTASLAGKSPHSFSATSAFAKSGHYGFHVDAAGLAGWFRSIAVTSGVEEVQAAVAKVAPNGRGGIAQVVCDDGKAVPGDLFLDCRTANDGDASVTNWISWNDQFSCDRVANIRTPGKRQVPVFTRTVGHNNGWSRTIPLAAELEQTYAFCSQKESDAEATQRLQSISNAGMAGSEGVEANVQVQSIRHGRRSVFWKDNVVALGNAACQLDPVAAMDLHLHQVGIELLMELFPDRKIGRATRAEYNARMSSIADELRDVAQLHHALRRSSSANSENGTGTQSAALQQMLAVYDSCGTVRAKNPESMPSEEIRSFLAGCGRLPDRPSLAMRAIDPNRIQHVLRETVKHNEAAVKDLPLHEELLDWIHAGPFQQSAG